MVGTNFPIELLKKIKCGTEGEVQDLLNKLPENYIILERGKWYADKNRFSTTYHKTTQDRLFQVSICIEPLGEKGEKGHVNFFRIGYSEPLSEEYGVRILSLGPGTTEYFAEAEKNIPTGIEHRPMSEKEIEDHYYQFAIELLDFPDERIEETVWVDLYKYRLKALDNLKEQEKQQSLK